MQKMNHFNYLNDDVVVEPDINDNQMKDEKGTIVFEKTVKTEGNASSGRRGRQAKKEEESIDPNTSVTREFLKK